MLNEPFVPWVKGEFRTRNRNISADFVTAELQHLSVLLDTSTTPATVLRVPRTTGTVYHTGSVVDSITDLYDDAKVNRTRVNPMTKTYIKNETACRWTTGYPNFEAEPREEISQWMDIDGSAVGHLNTVIAELRTDAERKAREALWNRIPGIWQELSRHDFDAAMFIAELSDLRRIWSTALARAKGGFSYWREIYTRSRETWLEAQLALKPLYSDVVAATEAIAEFCNRLDEVAPLVHKGCYAGAQAKALHTYTCIPYGVSNGLRADMEISATCVARYFCAYDPKHRVNTEGLTRMVSWLHRLNLHSTNVMILWESIPWSFVADYFVNIGDTLQMLLVERPPGLVREGYSLQTTITTLLTGEPYQTEGFPIKEVEWGFKRYEKHYTRVAGTPPKPSVLDFVDFSFWPGLTRATTTVLLVDPLARRAFRSSLRKQQSAERAARRELIRREKQRRRSGLGRKRTPRR